MSVQGASHRPEIDGLRAFAVLSVVLFHFSVPGFGGGFVGVDVFFVISGFLIGDILWRELNRTGSISLKSFYYRRIKRLAPAFVAVAIVTFTVSYFVLLPFEFREFGKELISSTVYLSNVYFFMKAGYFDTIAEDKLFLHTWSLSVEEQFYIFLPLTMILFVRSPTWLIRVLAAIFSLSLLSCIAVTVTSHTAAFYLFPFRAWELLTGVLLAISVYHRKENWRHAAWISWAGLAMLIASVMLIEPGKSFPGVQAIFPVLGTAMLIFNGQHRNPVNRAFSFPPVVFVGLISYSLYLWHWPVLTLSRYYSEAAFTFAQTVALLALCLALASLSWRFIEQPFRYGLKLRPIPLFASAAAASVMLLSVGSAVYLRDGLPDRFPPAIRAHIQASSDFLQDFSRCYVPDTGPFEGVEVCPLGPEGQPKFLVWGDSHVRAFKEGLAALAKESGEPGLLIWHAGCPPLFNIEKRESAATRQQDADCTTANERIHKAIPQLNGVKKLLLIGRWSYYAEGHGVGRDSYNTISLRPSGKALRNETNQHALFNEAVRATINELSQSIDEILVLRQVPEIPEYDSRTAARRLAHHRITPEEAQVTMFTVAKKDVIARAAPSERVFRELAAEHKIRWIQSWPEFCEAKSCNAMRNGRALYFDNNHITNQTALSVRHIFDPLVDFGQTPILKSEATH